MASLDLTFVGSGNAFAPGGLCWNGFVVNGRHLFEAPPQALWSLNTLGIDPNEIDTVVISHHHGDHFLGLPMLLLHWKHRSRTRPVTIVGPPETERIAREICGEVYPGAFEDLRYELTWREVRPGTPERLPGLVIEPVEVLHDERLSLNLGYACEIDGRRLAYTGDTALCDGVYDLARAGDVLVAECAAVEAKIPIHMNLREDIPQVRGAMPGDAQLVLTHITPGVTEDGLANTRVAKDLETFVY